MRFVNIFDDVVHIPYFSQELPFYTLFNALLKWSILNMLFFRSNYLALLRIERIDFHLIPMRYQGFHTFSSPCPVASVSLWNNRFN